MLNVSTEYVITEADRKFIDEINVYIRDHMSNPETSVESLSTHLSISRVQLYKRMISLTGITPSEYLRTKRIKFAEHLLRYQRNTPDVSPNIRHTNFRQ